MKASLGKEKNSGNDVVSAQQAEDLKMKEKRKREREKNLPRKKRRKLEAAREMLEEENESGDSEEENKKGRKDKSGIPLVDVAYRRAKAIKAGNKAQEAGKKIKKIGRKATQPQSRTEEMQELFQTDMSERRLKKTVQRAGQKAKSSFKSKSRYKRK